MKNPLITISEVQDGNMLLHNDKENSEVNDNRKNFLKNHGIDIKKTTRVNIAYEGDDYKRYFEVTDSQVGLGMLADDIPPSDALVTRSKNNALFLPIADCVGTVIYDPAKQVLMLSHLGRHSLEQFGGKASVEFLASKYGSNPADLLVWLSPAAGKDTYPVFAFDNHSLKEVAIEQLISAGVSTNNITDNPADTAKDPRYYSHSAYLRGQKTEDGRFAIVAMMQ